MLIRAGAAATAVMAVLGLAAYLGLDPPPWAAKAEMIRLAETAQSNKRQLLIQERRYWRRVEREAERELDTEPGSASAARERDLARDALADIDRALHTLPRD